VTFCVNASSDSLCFQVHDLYSGSLTAMMRPHGADAHLTGMHLTGAPLRDSMTGPVRPLGSGNICWKASPGRTQSNCERVINGGSTCAEHQCLHETLCILRSYITLNDHWSTIPRCCLHQPPGCPSVQIMMIAHASPPQHQTAPLWYPTSRQQTSHPASTCQEVNASTSYLVVSEGSNC
jgi:hypothetical protein